MNMRLKHTKMRLLSVRKIGIVHHIFGDVAHIDLPKNKKYLQICVE